MHSHFLLVRCLRRYPAMLDAARDDCSCENVSPERAFPNANVSLTAQNWWLILDRHLTLKNLRTELDSLRLEDERSGGLWEVPYGAAWVVALCAELSRAHQGEPSSCRLPTPICSDGSDIRESNAVGAMPDESSRDDIRWAKFGEALGPLEQECTRRLNRWMRAMVEKGSASYVFSPHTHLGPISSISHTIFPCNCAKRISDVSLAHLWRISDVSHTTVCYVSV